MGQGVIERPTQPLPPFRRSPPSPLSLTGCPGRPPQPLLLRPSSVPFPSSPSPSLNDDPPAIGLFWPLPRPPGLAKDATNVQPATGPPSPAIGLFWPLPRCPGLAQDVEPTSSQLPGPPRLSSASSGRCPDAPAWRKTSNQRPASYRAPLACHRPLLAGALVRGFPALVLRLRLRYKDLPPRFFANKLTPFRGSMGSPSPKLNKALEPTKKK